MNSSTPTTSVPRFEAKDTPIDVAIRETYKAPFTEPFGALLKLLADGQMQQFGWNLAVGIALLANCAADAAASECPPSVTSRRETSVESPASDVPSDPSSSGANTSRTDRVKGPTAEILKAAVLARDDDRLDDALKLLHRAIEMDPESAELLVERARVYMKIAAEVAEAQGMALGTAVSLNGTDSGLRPLADYVVENEHATLFLTKTSRRLPVELDYAQRDLTRVGKLTPNSHKLFVATAWLHYYRGESESAKQQASRAIECRPDDPECWSERGWIHLLGGQPPNAIADFNRSLELAAAFHKARVRRAYAYFSSNQEQRAIADLDHVLERQPRHFDALSARAFMLDGKQHHTEAIRDCDAAIALKPRTARLHHLRGQILLKTGDEKQALRAFAEAIRWNPNCPDYYDDRAQAHRAAGRIAEALDDISRAIEIRPDIAGYYRFRADCHRKLGQNNAARDDSRRAAWTLKHQQLALAVHRNPERVKGWIELARHLKAGERWEQSLELLDHSLTLEPENSAVYVERAAIRLHRQEYEQAIADATAALDRGPDPEARSIRGDAYLALKNYDPAIADYEASLRLDAHVARAYWERAKLRREKGRFAEADKDRERALSLDRNLRD